MQYEKTQEKLSSSCLYLAAIEHAQPQPAIPLKHMQEGLGYDTSLVCSGKLLKNGAEETVQGVKMLGLASKRPDSIPGTSQALSTTKGDA